MTQDNQRGEGLRSPTPGALKLLKRPQTKVIAFRAPVQSGSPERPDPPTNPGQIASRRLTSMLPVNQAKFVKQVRAALHTACYRYGIEIWAGERYLLDDLRKREMGRRAA